MRWRAGWSTFTAWIGRACNAVAAARTGISPITPGVFSTSGEAGAAIPRGDCGTLPTGVAGAGSWAVGAATAASGTEPPWPVRDTTGPRSWRNPLARFSNSGLAARLEASVRVAATVAAARSKEERLGIPETFEGVGVRLGKARTATRRWKSPESWFRIERLSASKDQPYPGPVSTEPGCSRLSRFSTSGRAAKRVFEHFMLPSQENEPGL